MMRKSQSESTLLPYLGLMTYSITRRSHLLVVMRWLLVLVLEVDWSRFVLIEKFETLVKPNSGRRGSCLFRTGRAKPRQNRAVERTEPHRNTTPAASAASGRNGIDRWLQKPVMNKRTWNARLTLKLDQPPAAGGGDGFGAAENV